jgi:tRNA A-37 threonylcarbamoyl transferase component Bud32
MSARPASSEEKILGLDPRARLRPGCEPVARVGDYELLERIAEGGMGVIWRAWQVSLGRVVALKMIRSGLLASEAEVRRFHREAEAAAALDHPHIVPIYEVGEDDGRHFFSMKLIEGGNLADLSARCDPARRSAAWAQRAAGIVATMAHAVHHAHQRGVLHRDVKPTNVLLDVKGAPHLTDFGLAKFADGAAGVTQTLAVIGTPHYMAPEQAAGGKQPVTISADIYSLGALLYELLCGAPPFAADSTLELLRQVQEQEPPPVRKSNPGLNADLATICHKCLQKLPGDRYATAEELAADLDRWLAGKPIHARPVGAARRLWLWSRRNRAAAIAGVLLLALAIVSTVSALHLRRHAARRGDDAAGNRPARRAQLHAACRAHRARRSQPRHAGLQRRQPPSRRADPRPRAPRLESPRPARRAAEAGVGFVTVRGQSFRSQRWRRASAGPPPPRSV